MNKSILDQIADDTEQRILDLKRSKQNIADEKAIREIDNNIEREKHKLTEQRQEAQAARNLKRLWIENKHKGGYKRTYEDIATKNGVVKSLVSNYINGRQPMNSKWVFEFAKYLEVEPSAINPHLTDKMGIGSVLDTQIIKLLENDDCTYEFKQAMLTLLKLHITENASDSSSSDKSA